MHDFEIPNNKPVNDQDELSNFANNSNPDNLAQRFTKTEQRNQELKRLEIQKLLAKENAMQLDNIKRKKA